MRSHLGVGGTGQDRLNEAPQARCIAEPTGTGDDQLTVTHEPAPGRARLEAAVDVEMLTVEQRRGGVSAHQHQGAAAMRRHGSPSSLGQRSSDPSCLIAAHGGPRRPRRRRRQHGDPVTRVGAHHERRELASRSRVQTAADDEHLDGLRPTRPDVFPVRRRRNACCNGRGRPGEQRPTARRPPAGADPVEIIGRRCIDDGHGRLVAIEPSDQLGVRADLRDICCPSRNEMVDGPAPPDRVPRVAAGGRVGNGHSVDDHDTVPTGSTGRWQRRHQEHRAADRPADRHQLVGPVAAQGRVDLVHDDIGAHRFDDLDDAHASLRSREVPRGEVDDEQIVVIDAGGLEPRPGAHHGAHRPTRSFGELTGDLERSRAVVGGHEHPSHGGRDPTVVGHTDEVSGTTTRYDAVVVGAGPNGLVAACTLAAAGRSVLVLEAGSTVGGGCRSAELTVPGAVHDVCAAVFALAAASPALTSIDLERLGVEWVHPDAPLAHPLDGGRAAVLHRDLDATVASLGADGRSWRRLVEPGVRGWERLLDDVLGPIVSLPRHPVELGRFARRALVPATRTVRRFHTDEAAALFGGCAAHAFLPLSAPFTTAFGLLLALAAHTVGWPVARGGAQTVPDALARRLVELGGEIRVGTRVRSFEDLPPHRVALFDTDPGQMAAIAGDELPARYRRALERYRHGPAAFKLDLALDGPVPWAAEVCHSAGTVHLGGTVAEIAAAEADVTAGRMPDRPFVLVVQPSRFDPSRAPEGVHTVWTYAHVPHGYAGDAAEAIERQLERFAPGVRDRIIGRHTMAPADFASYNPNDVGGDIAGGAHNGLQLFARPTRSLRAYSTPNPAIWLCSASTPPGGGVHGMSGANAAARVLAGPLR